MWVKHFFHICSCTMWIRDNQRKATKLICFFFSRKNRKRGAFITYDVRKEDFNLDSKNSKLCENFQMINQYIRLVFKSNFHWMRIHFTSFWTGLLESRARARAFPHNPLKILPKKNSNVHAFYFSIRFGGNTRKRNLMKEIWKNRTEQIIKLEVFT